MKPFILPLSKTFLLITLLSSCSNEAVYRSLQHNEKSECEKMPTQDEYQSCMSAIEQSYREYEKELDQEE